MVWSTAILRLDGPGREHGTLCRAGQGQGSRGLVVVSPRPVRSGPVPGEFVYSRQRSGTGRAVQQTGRPGRRVPGRPTVNVTHTTLHTRAVRVNSSSDSDATPAPPRRRPTRRPRRAASTELNHSVRLEQGQCRFITSSSWQE